jgi:hypothetical protein
VVVPGPAFGAPGARIDLDIGVVGVRFPGEQGGDLVALGTLGEFGEAGDGVVDQRAVALAVGELHQLQCIGELTLDRAGRPYRMLQPLALAHHLLRRLGIVPQRRLLDLGVQLFQPAVGAVPVEEPAQQRGGGLNLLNMGLRFGAHVLNSIRSSFPPKRQSRFLSWAAGKNAWLPLPRR